MNKREAISMMLLCALATAGAVAQEHSRHNGPNAGDSRGRLVEVRDRQQDNSRQGSNPPSQNSQQNGAPPSQSRGLTRGPGPHNGDWLRRYGQLPPQEQEKKLEQDQLFRKLPEDRKEKLKQRLQNFNQLPPTQRQRLLDRMEVMEHLSPDQQRQAQSLFQQFRGLDPDRKQALKQTLRRMRSMPPEARQRMLDSGELRGFHSDQEIQMLRGFNDLGFNRSADEAR